MAAIYHDATNSESGLVSLLHNPTPKGQLRVNAQFRHDFFQVPYDPSQNEYECSSDRCCSSGLRNGQSDSDSFVIANWVHTFSPKAMLLDNSITIGGFQLQLFVLGFSFERISDAGNL